jgi:hypothetical protein
MRTLTFLLAFCVLWPFDRALAWWDEGHMLRCNRRSCSKPHSYTAELPGFTAREPASSTILRSVNCFTLEPPAEEST